MIENTGFAAFALFNALKLHFTSDSYDYVKYNGKTNVSRQTFSTRKDKYSFYRLSRKYNLEQLKNYYIANFLVEDIQWVGDMIGPEGEENFKKWQKRTDSLTYTFQNDIMYLVDKHQPVDWIKVSDGYPKLLDELMKGAICIESVTILNNLMNFLPMWKEKIEDDIIWPKYERTILKYTPFVHYNKEKFANIVKESLKEYA